MENRTEDKNQVGRHRESGQDFLTDQKMTAQKKRRCNKPFFIALFLVIFILGVYTLHYRPNAAKRASEKQHADWLTRMKNERASLGNDTLGYRHDERHEATQSGISAGQGNAPISMVMPSNVPEDLHRAQTREMYRQYVPDKANSTNKLIEMKLDQTQRNGENDTYDDYKQENDDDDDDDRGHDDDEDNRRQDDDEDNHRHDDDEDNRRHDDDEDADREEESNEQYDRNTVTTTIAPGLQPNIQTAPDTASEFQPKEQNESANATGLQSNVQSIPGTGIGLQSNVQIEPGTGTGLQSNVQTEPSTGTGLQSNVQTETGTGTGLQSNVQIEQGTGTGLQSNVQSEPGTATGLQSNVENEPDKGAGLQSNVQNELQQNQESLSNYTKTNTIQMQLAPGSYVKPGAYEYNNPRAVGDSNIPSYNVELNNKPVVGQQKLGTNKDVAYGSVLSDTNVHFPDANVQRDTQAEKYRLSQTYHNRYDRIENNIAQPAVNIGVNRALQAHGATTVSPLTLPGLIENRMVLHKALKDMRDIVNYGSAATDEENKKPWNEGENRKHLYDVNDKNMFANLQMQVNSRAEPVTGTKPMRPPYKSRLEYPDYLTPINWRTSFEHVKTPVFECVPMRTLSSYIRICIHPPAIQSEVSSSLKSGASWECNALRDVQKALLQNRDSVLIDIGASFGVFSLAAAAINRNAIAVEPFPSHIQVLKQSVTLNSFTDHITLFQAVVSDRRGKVLIKPLGDHVNNVYIQTVEDYEQSTNYTLVVNTVTLDDIEKVCPSRIAVLKIDVPGFMKKALEYSHFFFKYIYVTHVFMHWDTKDRELCLFILRFFVEKGYLPYRDLYGSKQLELKDAYYWPNDIVIWKL